MAKAPFVAMQTDLRKEDRVDVIAEMTGFDRDSVLGKLFRLWAFCTDRGLEDAPSDCDGYAVPDRVVRQFLGPRGPEAILGDGCDELAMGERRPDGLIYLRGTHETVSRLRALRLTAAAGGRSAVGNAARGNDGRFVRNQQYGQPTDRPATGSAPADDRPLAGSEPAASSEIPQTTDHIEEEIERGASAPEPSRSGPRKKRRCRIPEDWQPAERERQQAIAAGINLAVLTARFTRHYRANGQVNLNWDEKFAGWIETEAERRSQSRPANGHRQSVLTNLLTDIEILEREELEKARNA